MDAYKFTEQKWQNFIAALKMNFDKRSKSDDVNHLALKSSFSLDPVTWACICHAYEPVVCCRHSSWTIINWLWSSAAQQISPF